MAAHIWDTKNSWEYCQFEGCTIYKDTVILDYSKTQAVDDTDPDNIQFIGTIVSDIRDSTSRINNYDELIPFAEIPNGTSAIFSVRSGIYKEYDANIWSDWTEISDRSPIIELTLSLNAKKILVDYNIHELSDILYSDDPTFMQLARIKDASFINSITDETIEQYPILWDSDVDSARADFAKTDYDAGAESEYAKDALCVNNCIILLNELPKTSAPVIVEYNAKTFVYNGCSDRYFQWKCDLYSDDMGKTPIIKGFQAKYKLNFYNQIINEFPGLFRRI